MPTDFQDELDTYVAAKGAHESRCPEFDEAVLGRELTSEEQAELEALIDRRNEAAENVRFEPATSLSELRRKVEVAMAECLDRDGWLAAIAEDLEDLESPEGLAEAPQTPAPGNLSHCEVASLGDALGALLVAYNTLEGEEPVPRDPKGPLGALDDRICDIGDFILQTPARSLVGAATQIALAIGEIDRVLNAAHDDITRDLCDSAMYGLYSALGVLEAKGAEPHGRVREHYAAERLNPHTLDEAGLQARILSRDTARRQASQTVKAAYRSQRGDEIKATGSTYTPEIMKAFMEALEGARRHDA